MSRYSKPNQTIEDLKNMIEANGGLKEIVYNDKLKVYRDLLKVDMDFDHIGLLSESTFPSARGIPSYEMIGQGADQYPVAWCYANADGEWAVAFVIYIGREGKLRAYIPVDGNNISGRHSREKSAYSTSDMLYCSDHLGEYWFNYELMRDSVRGRIVVKR